MGTPLHGKTVEQSQNLTDRSRLKCLSLIWKSSLATPSKNTSDWCRAAIVGGELKAYTELLHQARQEATSRMEQQASAVGANAVLNVRYSTSSVAQGAAELFVYGTAVVLTENDTE